MNNPIPNRSRNLTAKIRPISQVTLRLKSCNTEDAFNSIVNDVLSWMAPRAGKPLPEVAWNRATFELADVGAQRVAAVRLTSPRYWAARIDDADKKVPLRTWVTEIGVGAEENGDVFFGVRLVCATRGDDLPFDRSIPSFVRKISQKYIFELDGHPIERHPKLIKSEQEVLSLVALLESNTRKADVIVFALPENSEDPEQTTASAVELHNRTFGTAHVFILTSSASYLLTDAVGKELSVFKGGIRTYRPGFQSWIDEPSNHPVALPYRVQGWAGEGPAAFERWLINQTLGNSAHQKDAQEKLPPFNVIRQFAAYSERENAKLSGGTSAELVVLYDQENARLQADMREQKELYDGLLLTAEEERDRLLNIANAAKSQAFERIHRIKLLEKRLKALEAASEETIPSSLDAFESWCKENLAGVVEVANKAFQGVRKSEYHDPSFLYKALILLRDFYAPMRIEGTGENRQAYISQLQILQLEESATGEGINYASELYSVQYGGIRRPLDRHLKGRDSRDRKYGFRLYFFWDEESQVVVVGWLPSHLDNRAT